MTTLKDIRLNSLNEQELLQEVSVGKIGSTFLVSRLLQQASKLKKSKEKDMQVLSDLMKTIGLMIYAVQLSLKTNINENFQ